MRNMRGAGALINAGINYAAYKNSNGSVSGFLSSMVKYQFYVFVVIMAIVALIFLAIVAYGGKVKLGFQNQINNQSMQQYNDTTLNNDSPQQ